MPFCSHDSLRYYVFSNLSEYDIPHGIFTRQGGVSRAPFASLNLGGTVGDHPGNVYRNREMAFCALQLDYSQMYDVWQVHSSEVVCAAAPRDPNTPHRRADAILTNTPGLALMMRFADCVPILLYDPVKKVIGLVHAGWEGTAKKIIINAVQMMKQAYQVEPGDLVAAIGPSIGAHHYEVGKEVVDKISAAFNNTAFQVLQRSDRSQDRFLLDLWKANEILLNQTGVTRIESAAICTACNMEDWYSHRGEKGKTGRFGAIISLSR